MVADFSAVRFEPAGPDRVRVSGGDGQARPQTLKVSVGYRDGFIGEGQISYAGPGAQDRGQLALELVRERLGDAGLGDFDSRFELIGLNALSGPVQQALHPRRPEPTEVRARVALRVATEQQAQAVAHEVEALYLNGPAGGGGATRSVKEVIAVASVLIPREWVSTRIELLGPGPGP